VSPIIILWIIYTFKLIQSASKNNLQRIKILNL
jgi:hypothetical protein